MIEAKVAAVWLNGPDNGPMTGTVLYSSGRHRIHAIGKESNSHPLLELTV